MVYMRTLDLADRHALRANLAQSADGTFHDFVVGSARFAEQRSLGPKLLDTKDVVVVDRCVALRAR